MVSAEPLSFAFLLRQYRLAAGLTQEQLAERAALSPRGISNLERSIRRAPYRYTVRQLADALELSPAERARFEAAARIGSTNPAPALSFVPRYGEEERRNLPRHNLPAQLTSFIGRNQEVAGVLKLLQRQDVRLLTLLGPAGIGKTRLALRVAERALRTFDGGVFFVPLASIDDAALVPPAIAAALQIDGATRTSIPGLARHLGEERTLLVFDNCEHLREAAGIIADLLRSCPRLSIVATSRAVLPLMAGQEYPVPPLSVPDTAARHNLHTLTRYDAIALFTDRARKLKPDFTLTPETAPAVVQICRRLDGLPLAIELASARIRMYSASDLATQLSQELGLLTDGASDRPERHRTLRAAIDWSFRLLSSSDRRLFTRLSVFAGGWTLEAAEAVCDPGAVLEVRAGVESLLTQSLLQREDDPAGRADAVPRFSMLETVGEFARERLAESGETDELQRRHAVYYLDLAEGARSFLRQGREAEWMTRLQREGADLQAAWRWCVGRGETELILRFGAALWYFWLARGHVGNGYDLLVQAIQNGAGVSPAVRVRALDAAGNLATVRGEYASAAAFHEEGLALSREMGDQQRITVALGNLGVAAKAQGDLPRAAALLRECEALYRAQDSRQGVASVLSGRGDLARLQGDYEEASSLLQQSQTMWRELGGDHGVARTSYLRALLALDQGDLAEGERLAREALRLLLKPVDRFGIADCLEALSRVAAGRGDETRADTLLAAAHTLHDGISAGASIRGGDEGPASGDKRRSSGVGPEPESRGGLMSLEEVIEYALADTAP